MRVCIKFGHTFIHTNTHTNENDGRDERLTPLYRAGVRVCARIKRRILHTPKVCWRGDHLNDYAMFFLVCVGRSDRGCRN